MSHNGRHVNRDKPNQLQTIIKLGDSMKMKSQGKYLIFIGTVIIVYSIFMDTSIEYQGQLIHNLPLQAKQQNLLILGGILFIGGIILFSITTLKATTEEERLEIEKKSESTRRSKEERRAYFEALMERAEKASTTANNNIKRGFSQEAPKLRRYMAVGWFVGISLAIIGSTILGYAAWLILPFCIFYAANTPETGEPTAIRHLLLTNSAVYLFATVISICIAAQTYTSNPEFGSIAFAASSLVGLIPVVISIFWLRKINRQPKIENQ